MGLQIPIKINLKNFKNAFVKKFKNKAGVMIDCILIPVEMNHIYIGEKGFYVDFQAFENPNPKADGKESHLLKQSLPSAIYKNLSDDEKKGMPLFGNLTILNTGPVGSTPNISGRGSTPAVVQQPSTAADDDDLPF